MNGLGETIMNNLFHKWIPILLILGFAVLYLMTAAPDIQAGDSAEFQLAAVTAGVPHPTTYPLYVVLTHLTTYMPFGAPAWRVTAFSAIAAAIASGISWWWLVANGHRPVIATISVIALGVAPGIWNAATIAEVYALLILLMVGTLFALQRMVQTPTPHHLVWVMLLVTLGTFHHGLFVLTITPMAFFICVWIWHNKLHMLPWRWLILIMLIGLLPLTYPLVQFARYGPFNGLDYGLPTHYFWGAPQSWREVVDLMTGGAVRRDLFQIPSISELWQMSVAIIRRMGYEFGPIGLSLIGIGAINLAIKNRQLFGLSLFIAVPTTCYVLAIGPGIIDWPAFTIPLLIPLTLYLAWGIEWGYMRISAMTSLPAWRTHVAIAGVLLATLAWGYHRYPVSAKQHLTLYREFADTVHRTLPANAVVITHWEQGMTLQYLRYAEGLRSDVWIDVVEPGDDPWLDRAQRLYAGRKVFFIGHDESVANMPVTTVFAQPYATLYRLETP